jgi:hypothetical protein
MQSIFPLLSSFTESHSELQMEGGVSRHCRLLRPFRPTVLLLRPWELYPPPSGRGDDPIQPLLLSEHGATAAPGEDRSSPRGWVHRIGRADPLLRHHVIATREEEREEGAVEGGSGARHVEI